MNPRMKRHLIGETALTVLSACVHHARGRRAAGSACRPRSQPGAGCGRAAGSGADQRRHHWLAHPLRQSGADPTTVLTVDKLAANTPTSVPDALTKMPA